MTIHQFSFPTTIRFGPGSRLQLPEYLKMQNLTRPLLVTDRGIATLPILQDMVSHLTASGCAVGVFSEVWGNPVKSQVTAGVEAFRAHHADSIIGLGGGAALDVAKAVALMATHAGDLFDYEDGKPDARPIDGALPFWVALPTTSGTGSEVGRSTVISDDHTHIKKIVFSPKLLARAVFADPQLTLDLPAKITAATGMDALTHCVEAYLAKDYHPICDGIALEGLRLAAENLERCMQAPRDIQARSGMMMAALMGAIAFQKGLGVTHSCAHALSTVADLHHGLANGIMIDYALSINLPTTPERFQAMARTIGLADSSGPGFIRWLADLKRAIGIPQKLSEAGIKKDQVERLSDLAFQDACHLNNPRPCTRADFVKIYSDAL